MNSILILESLIYTCINLGVVYLILHGYVMAFLHRGSAKVKELHVCGRCSTILSTPHQMMTECQPHLPQT